MQRNDLQRKLARAHSGVDSYQSTSDELSLLFLISLLERAGHQSVNTVPMLWPYEDGTVRISCAKFQESLFLQKNIQYMVWHKCIDHCKSNDQHVWIPVAWLKYDSGTILVVNGSDASIYDLNRKGILTIRGQTVADNGTEYRCDVRTKYDVESDHVLLLDYDKGKEGNMVNSKVNSTLK